MATRTYVNVGLPEDLVDDIDKLLDSGETEYQNRSQVVQSGVRSLLQAVEGKQD